MVKLLKEAGIPIRKADIGNITREDFIEGELIQDKYRKVILTFNIKVDEQTINEAKNFGLKIFSSNIIYRIIDEYKQWIEEEKKKEIEAKLAALPRPVKVRVIPGAIFRSSKPAIFGVDVLEGTLKPGIALKREGKVIGTVKEIQSEGRTIPQAIKGERVAISIEDAVVGRSVFENDVLVSELSREDIEKLKEVFDYLREDEKKLLIEIIGN
jgi:translation initiation factor 5B